MAVGNLTLAANVSGLPDGARTFGPLTIMANQAVVGEIPVALVNGTTTVNVPTGATCVVFVGPNGAIPTPNPAYAGTITLNGAAVSAKLPSLLSWDTANTPATLTFVATTTGTGVCWFM